MLHFFQPPSRSSLTSSRALLRSIERAAIEAEDLEERTTTAIPQPLPGGFGRSVWSDLEAHTSLMREQVDAFLTGQVCEAKRQVEEAQAARNLLHGCLQRMKDEQQPRQSGKGKKEGRLLRGQNRARSTPPLKAAADPKDVSNLGKLDKANVNATVCEAWKRVHIEELYQEYLQLKISLAKSRAETSTATLKSDELQAQVDALLEENAKLKLKTAEYEEESHALMYAAASKERQLTLCLKDKQDRIEYLQIEKRLEEHQTLAKRGDANTLIHCMDALQRDYDKLVHECAQVKQVQALPFISLSAQVLSAEPLVLGIEAEEEAAPDAISELYTSSLADAGCRQAFCLGRVKVPINLGEVPVCVKVTLKNDGDSPWPQTVAAVLVSGDALGCPLVALGQGPLLSGALQDFEMDLLVPTASEPGVGSSMWALVNAANGHRLGPLLVFEAVYTKQ